MPPKSITTFCDNILNSDDYESRLLNPGDLPQANIVIIDQSRADATNSGTYTLGTRTLLMGVKIKDYANRDALREQLMVWCAPGVRGELVGPFDDGDDYQLDCQVQIAPTRSDDSEMYFIVTLLSTQTAWRAVDADTATWNPSATGGTKTINVGGTMETRLSITLTPTSGPPGVWLYQNIVELVNVPGVNHGYKSWCITLNTAALVAAGYLREDCNDLMLTMNGVRIPRWITNPNTTSSNIFFNATLSAGYDLTLSPGSVQIETATAVGTITADGNATVIVTAAGMTGSPKTLNVAVLNTDTAATWAGKVRTALLGDGAVTALFTVGGSGALITLTRLVPAANDSTLNISLANGTCTGIVPDTSSSNTQAGYVFSVASSGDVATLEFTKDTTTKAKLTAMPLKFILKHGTEWFSCQKTTAGIANCSITVLQRGVLGTTEQAHAGGDVFYYIQNSIVMFAGNAAAVNPATGNAKYNDTKPQFDLELSDATQATWGADSLFYQSTYPSKPGTWTPFLSRKGTGTYTYKIKGNATSGDPAMGVRTAAYLKNAAWVADQIATGWKFFATGGIRRVTYTLRTYRSDTVYPVDAKLQASPTGTEWVDVAAESSPGSAGAYTSVTHTNVDIDDTSNYLRMLFAGLSDKKANSYQLFEILTMTTYWKTANIPSLTLLGWTSNFHLDVTINNQATANNVSVDDSFELAYPMKIDKDMVVDGEVNTVQYQNINMHSAMTLDDESRTVFARLLGGVVNTVRISSNGGLNMGLMTILLSWYKRRL